MSIKTSNIFPWHQRQWQRLIAARKNGKVPHAVFLAGPRGLGKELFARHFAALSLCRGDPVTEWPCGECRDCALFAAGNHPDYLSVGIPEDKTQILVDQIRSLREHMLLKSYTGGHKVTVVAPADAMNPNAANSLLKILEEPPPSTLLILSGERPAALPATIISRCQKLVFPLPDRRSAIEWLEGREPGPDWAALLEFAGGSPLRAIELHGVGFGELEESWRSELGQILTGRADAVAVAAAWAKREPELALNWLHGWVQTLIRWRAGGLRATDFSESRRRDLQNTGKAINIRKLMAYLDRLESDRVRQKESLNMQLTLESLLIPWATALDGVDPESMRLTRGRR